MKLIDLKDVKKYYVGLPHQKAAVSWLGGLLLNTPAKNRLKLETEMSWLNCVSDQLDWLQNQISEGTLEKFAALWRLPNNTQGIDITLFSQRDNSILPFVTCSSSSHAMYVDHQLRRNGKNGLSSDEGYLRRVFSGKYGKYGKNPSISWDIQTRVCYSYGISSKYIWNSDLTGLAREVEKNGSSVINIYHKGTHKGNRGGGHVVLLADLNKDRALIHDPYGTRPPHYRLKNVGATDVSRSPVTQPKASSEYDILKAVTLCEARGEGVLGMALVARVILNRVNLTRLKKENFNTTDPSIRGIVYAPWQFEPTWSKTNNISTIYDRVNTHTQGLAEEAIALAQNTSALHNRLNEKGLPVHQIDRVIRSTFFAAATHPQAITPYTHHTPIRVGRQIFGEGKNTREVPLHDLCKKIYFEDTIANQPINLRRVGIYEMDMDEFNWRWQGCYRYLT